MRYEGNNFTIYASQAARYRHGLYAHDILSRLRGNILLCIFLIAPTVAIDQPCIRPAAMPEPATHAHIRGVGDIILVAIRPTVALLELLATTARAN
jgi:hypothetical protein